MKRFAILLTLSLLTSCRSGPPIVEGDADRLPQPLAIELRTVEPGKRAAMYRLEASGDLYFGGGREAKIRQAIEPAGRLNDEQRMQLWRIIQKHKLLEASGQFMPKPQRVEYEVTLQAGSKRNRFHTVDARVPGLDELEKKLYGLQAEKRYGGVINAVEEKIRKGGEDVKRK